MKNIKVITNYTFQEVLNLYPAYSPVKPHDKNVTSGFFSSMMSDADLAIPDSLSVFGDAFSDVSDMLNLLIWNIYNRHSEDYIYSKEGDLDVSDFPKAVNGILNVIDNTIDKYAPMVLQVANKASDLLEPVKQVQDGDIKFNDTPQNAGVGETDDYTSTYTKNHSEGSVDVGSTIERLSEMFGKYKSIMLLWSNEFNILFLKEEQ